MVDFLLVDGDKVIFNPTFGEAIVVVQPGTLSGSAKETLNDKKLCVKGDESSVSVEGCMYTSPVYSVPGFGTLTIKQLAHDQVAQKKSSGGKPVLLKGGSFTANFQVQTPAQMPPPTSTPDPMPEYTGSGNFITSNYKWKSN